MTEILNAVAADRRNMLGLIGIGGLGAVLAGAAATRPSLLSSSSSKDSVALPPLSLADGALDHWRRAVGMRFSVGGTAAILTLRAVKPLLSAGERPASVTRSHAFAAVFEAPANAPIEGNRTYRLATRLVAPLDVHLGSAVAAGAASQYLAIFN
ncbi:DUF6916 family protein [Allosphingosinicella deserti]|uniref:DUF6916 domain-containing protein n=1 Tax=Allosphingosinicella deserti TaxID=2116704 RepID=A0A2P7QK92_9SPHN|nr:hypothetical protein [Sphingomonas deserti]PSJ38352.1 hypothetical protein C7I55_18030 [Sphingomonas deserti]